MKFNCAEFFIDLLSRGVIVFEQDQRIKIKSSCSQNDSSLVDEIRQKKSIIQSFFKQHNVQSSAQIGKLSLQQNRIWLVEQIESSNSQYNLPGILELNGALDTLRLERAVKTIVNRHDILRTTYFQIDGKPYQFIKDKISSEKQVEIVNLAPGATDKEVAELIAKEGSRPFDLELDFPFRAKLIKRSLSHNVFLITMHHISTDAWSVELFLSELTELYNVNDFENADKIDKASIQYLDYVDWQNTWRNTEIVESDAQYWLQRLQGIPSVHNIRLDKQRPKVQGVKAGHYWQVVDEQFITELQSFCHKYQMTMFIVLQTAFACFISRYSSESDIVMGTPVANRHQSDLNSLIGFFVNTLVLRTEINGNDSFLTLLDKNKLNLLADFDHQQFPFELLVEKMNPERNLSHSSLFQIMFAFQSHRRKSLHFSGLEPCFPKQGYTASKYDLTLEIIDSDNGFNFHWEFAESLFNKLTITEMAESFFTFVRTAVVNPTELIKNLDVLSPRQYSKVINAWNNTNLPNPKSILAHELFEQAVTNQPNACALLIDSQKLSYAELNTKANKLAHLLISKYKVRPDTLIGICVDRSFDMVISALAVLKAGAAYVPLDPKYPQARLTYMQRDAKLNILLSKSYILRDTGLNVDNILLLDQNDLKREIDQQASHNPQSCELGLGPEHLAYVIYTSGSSGKPKGVLLEHRGLANLALAQKDRFRIRECSRVLQFASFSFDAATFEIFMALSNGATLVLISNETYGSATELSSTVAKESVTHATLPPALLPSLDKAYWHTVKTLIVAGDTCPKTLAQEWSTNRNFINAYGPSETTVCATAGEILENQSLVHIGTPLQNTQIFILNDGELAPIGGVGELCIGGLGLARSYLDREELTRQKFIPNPFYDPTLFSSSRRLYKTGDLARWLPDGTIEFLQRIDRQVKLRGFRIELGEIENAITDSSFVKECVVDVFEKENGDKSLVAYIVGPNSKVPNYSELIQSKLKEHLEASLPAYMLPSFYIVLDELPLSANGKIDRKALPAPNIPKENIEFVAPVTRVQHILAEIWKSVLSIDQVGLNDNFFNLGGHSLLIMQVTALAAKKNISISAHQLFQNPCLGALSAEVERTSFSSNSECPQTSIPDDCNHISPAMLPLVDSITDAELDLYVAKIPGGGANIKDIYPLAPLQEGILFHHMMNAKNDPYVMPILFKIKDKNTFNDFINGLQFVFDRHDALRTAVVWQAMPQPLQVVCKRVDVPIAYVNADVGEDAESHLRKVIENKDLAINLEQAPLFRLKVCIDKSNGHYYVLGLLHHIISDHVCIEIIKAEIDMYRCGRAKELDAPLPYRDFVALTLKQANSTDAKTYFRDLLGDIDEPTSPFGLLDINRDGLENEKLTLELDPEISKSICSLAKMIKVSKASIFHACWCLVISACSGRNDVVFGTVMSGRLQANQGSANILGMFINTLPLRVKLVSQSVSDFITKVHRSLSELIPYEHTSLAITQNSAKISGNAPLFSALINYRHSNDSVQREHEKLSNGVEVLYYHEGNNYPFCLAVDDFGQRFNLEFQVDKSVDVKRISEYMLTSIRSVLDALSGGFDIDLQSLNILPVQEQQQLLEWNPDAIPASNHSCIHELFEEQANRTPGALALVFEDQKLSYGELNKKANRLAHYLIEQRGVKPNTLIGICIERSIEMVVCILGVLKAGAAYVPLDPEYPAQRLKYMLDDAALETVLTQSYLQAKNPIDEKQALCIDCDSVQQRIGEQASANIKVSGFSLSNNALAYVIYTSGSTGQPKGVLAPHKSIINRILWMEEVFPTEVNEIFCQKTSAGFVDHVAEIFQALCAGRPLIIVSTADTLDNQNFARIVSQYKITRLTLVPSLLKSLIENESLEKMTSLKLVISSGESLHLEECRQFYRALPGTKLVNLYGSSEVGADVSAYAVDSIEDNPEVMQYFLESESDEQYKDNSFRYQAPSRVFENEDFREQYSDSSIPQGARKYDDYINELNEHVLPFSVDVSAQRFIGHMTSKLPSFIPELSRLITQLNQNMVKVETSNNLTLLERQVLGMMHRLFFQESAAFYDANCQNPEHVFGTVTSGGSVANLTALWCARNTALLNLGFDHNELVRIGAHRAMQSKGFERAVILGTRLMHYSMRKSVAVMGLGEDALMYVKRDRQQKMCLSDLQQQIQFCAENNILIIAVVGIAGATENGSIDPLKNIAEIAQQHNIHFHVDAAWGGAFQMSPTYRHLISGIEQADSLTFCPHKQLYLSQGISLCLLKNTSTAKHIATHASYQSQKGSFDLGQYSIEGSRPALALLLHASMHLLGGKGYAWLIEQSMLKTKHFLSLLDKSASFELIGTPELNIITYRYLPVSLRSKTSFSESDTRMINESIERIQQQQFASGNSFVSRTALRLTDNNDESTHVFRIVISNPTTSLSDLEAVLADQLVIANELIEKESDYHLNELPKTCEQNLKSYAKWKVPIGKPIANTQLLVLDSEQRLLPLGVAGELYVGGQGLAMGYLNRDQLTADKFVANPYFDPQKGNCSEKIFRTGDLVRWLPDGNLEYINRKDHQVKIRGFRIELGEIESVIMAHEFVHTAVVVAADDAFGEAMLMAYVSLNEASAEDLKKEPEAEQYVGDLLREFLGGLLPKYMIPNRFVLIEKFPLSPNKKIDRKALPVPHNFRVGRTYIAPRNEAEQGLCTLFSEVLGVDQVGIKDDFFSLGGDSLKAVRLVSLAKAKDFGFELRNLYDYPVEALCRIRLLGREKLANRHQQMQAGYLPLTVDQKNFFEHINVHPECSEITLTTHYDDINIKYLKAAIKSAISRHEALRVKFERTQDVFKQILVPIDDINIKLEEHDLSGIPRSEQIRVIDSRYVARKMKGMKLSQAPLFRGDVYHLGARQGAVVQYAFHHLVADGFSWTIISDDINRAYKALASGEEPPTDMNGLPLSMWIKNLEKFVNRNLSDSESEYWKGLYWDGLSPIRSDFPELDKSVKLRSENTVKIELNSDILSRIKSFAAIENIPIIHLILSAILKSVSVYTNEKYQLIKVVDSGRDFYPDVDLSKTVGWLALSRTLFFDLNPSISDKDLSHLVHKQIQSTPNKGLGLELIRKFHKDSSLVALFDGYPKSEVLVNYHGEIDTNKICNSVFVADYLDSQSELTSYHPDNKSTEKLNFSAAIINGELHLSLKYNTELYLEDSINRIVTVSVDFLKTLGSEPLSKDTISSSEGENDYLK